jgi:phage shock protein A
MPQPAAERKDALTAGHDVDDELARMKAQLPTSAAPAAIEGTATEAASQPSPPATS